MGFVVLGVFCGLVFFGVFGFFFKPPYSESGKHMKKQFVYDIFTPKQNLPELKPLHSRLHKFIIQMQKK